MVYQRLILGLVALVVVEMGAVVLVQHQQAQQTLVAVEVPQVAILQQKQVVQVALDK